MFLIYLGWYELWIGCVLGWAYTVVGGPTWDLSAVYFGSVVYCRSDSTFKVERYPFYRGDSVEFSTDFS